MMPKREVDPLMGALYLAGELVPAGEYREINGRRTLQLYTDDVLPASLDGSVACYHRIETTVCVVRDGGGISKA